MPLFEYECRDCHHRFELLAELEDGVQGREFCLRLNPSLVVSQFTPVEPTYPNGGSLVVASSTVAGQTGGNPRYRISITTYQGYSYEIYGNPTLADLSWGALPFSSSQTGTINRNIYTATSDGTIDLYVEANSAKGFYYVSFRVPGANTGTP